MKYIPLNVKAIVESRSGVGEVLRDPGDAAVIKRDTPRWMILKCPCGCGEEIPINLDRRAGKAWRYYEDAGGGAALFPSVWRDTGCESHFIVWRGRILILGLYDRESDEEDALPLLLELVERVSAAWPSTKATSYIDVADELVEIPWDVLDACRRLASKGVLIEGAGRDRGKFRRR